MGWAARWWTKVSPGKISSPTGILRKLEDYRDEPGISPELRASHERAAAGIRAGHLQWRDAGTTHAPLEPAPPLAPLPPPQPDGTGGQGSLFAADAVAGDGIAYREGTAVPGTLAPHPPADPVISAIDRLTDAIMVLIRQNDAMLSALGVPSGGYTAPPPAEPTAAEWATLYAMAEHVPEG